MVKTVSLLTIRDKKLLVVLSKKHTLWTPPGGKLEPTDKNPKVALEREVFEELRVGLTNIQEHIGISGISASGRPVYVYTYLADLAGDPVPANEIVGFRWIGYTKEELETVSPVTRDIMSCMKAVGYF
ncbi:MAG: hypothetical protein UY16_C0072G0003 [Candidatus Gottesmanbacteria bacterium GW2011_GWA2_47_9]|uniref:Nudix hydrolase domain-containing protein n=2 Tax=Patescibacteria group TaxID=1783273 RepID=A0A0G1TUY8_9BACT|nr:MAG: hypothetical protein UT29_C0004G0028 [Candidatus Yanofskybacteria bacterium GW2011_GWA1_39_13]KKU85657.1 MAG: hypothetical protein UY16_C0072G0003 [Candidatus Gottesmanbacteria bacterium GW2011_GWA2_47_9]